MDWSIAFFANSALLGVGLAMDAFSVSMANGLNAPGMGRGQALRIAGTFAFFQFAMPMIGWACVSAASRAFVAFQRAVPWIALALLGAIGGKMLWEAFAHPEKAPEAEDSGPGGATLLAQGVATSIDALSVGFTIAEYGPDRALAASAVIAAVTFGICICGVAIGRRFGTKLAGRATALGGAILIFIGLEIFIKNVIK